MELVCLVYPYEMYGLAVNSLVSRSGRGPQYLVEYYRLLGEGASWQSAFEQSLGQTVGNSTHTLKACSLAELDQLHNIPGVICW